MTPLAETPSSLDPHGRGAHIIAREMWLQFGVAAFTFALVIGLLVWILASRARDDPPPEAVADERRPLRWLFLGGIAFPVVTLTLLFGWSVHDIVALDRSPNKPTIAIEVIGHRWWWEFRYPRQRIDTANELVLPAGESVRLHIRSADVIHSFWVPQLNRKLDAFPREWTTMWFRADDVGHYRGVCAEFCGLQHAHMGFVVDALPRGRFQDWVRISQSDARKPSSPSQRRGQQIFERQTCAYCHTIAGTAARGWLGPNLTHLAARTTLAAATIPNTRGNLAGWITDPQHVKPGTLMPPSQLSGPQLQRLLDYLMSLK